VWAWRLPGRRACLVPDRHGQVAAFPPGGFRPGRGNATISPGHSTQNDEGSRAQADGWKYSFRQRKRAARSASLLRFIEDAAGVVDRSVEEGKKVAEIKVGDEGSLAGETELGPGSALRIKQCPGE
jgi:hypothetical protein